jgi:hypothetical protein
VDYLVTNVGFFEFHESVPPSKYISWCHALSDRVIWKTTTMARYETAEKPNEVRPRFNAYDAEMCGSKHVHCMDTSWTLKVNSATDYWDSIHFNEPVYAILNDQLMDMLHKIPSSAEAPAAAAAPAEAASAAPAATAGRRRRLHAQQARNHTQTARP